MFSHFWSKNKTTVEFSWIFWRIQEFYQRWQRFYLNLSAVEIPLEVSWNFWPSKTNVHFKKETTACIFWHNVHILFQFERSSVKLWKSPETNQLLFLIWTKDSLFFTSNGWTELPWGWTKIPSWLWLKEHMVLANLNWVSKWFQIICKTKLPWNRITF